MQEFGLWKTIFLYFQGGVFSFGDCLAGRVFTSH